jgi:XTP/dITP diphosphohydrolase
MDGVDDRRDQFRTAVALVLPDGSEIVVDGVLDGVITESPRGDGGFGYDPVFEVEDRTLSEMGVAQKNRLSHRARALRALAEALGIEQ